MDTKTLETAQELIAIIRTEEEALVQLYEIKKKIEKPREGRKHSDGLFNLCISEYSDKSGAYAKLTRYDGNVELLETIINTLTMQNEKHLLEFKKL